MLESAVVNRIRHIFLHPRSHVSISQGTDLLGWTRAEMKVAIASGDVLLMTTPLGRWIAREELMAKALEVWSREAIEEALGADADTVLPHATRLAELRARVPRYQVAMLQYLAEREQTTVSEVLTRELEGVASEHAEALSSVVPGFAAAVAWPEAEHPQIPC